MNDFNEMKNMGENLVDNRSAFLNMLRDLDLSYGKLKKLYESIIVAFINASNAQERSQNMFYLNLSTSCPQGWGLNKRP